MKRLTLLLAVLILCTSSLFAISFGYGLSLEGYSGFNEGSSTRVTLALDFTSNRYLTLEAGAGVGLFGRSLYFSGVSADLGFRLFSKADHFMNFLFANDSLWTLRFTAGVLFDQYLDMAFRFSVSPLCFMTTSYDYEFLRPYFLFDTEFSYAGWGIDLIRVSYYF